MRSLTCHFALHDGGDVDDGIGDVDRWCLNVEKTKRE